MLLTHLDVQAMPSYSTMLGAKEISLVLDKMDMVVVGLQVSEMLGTQVTLQVGRLPDLGKQDAS